MTDQVPADENTSASSVESYDLSIKIRLGDTGRVELSMTGVDREVAQSMLDFCASSFGGRAAPPDAVSRIARQVIARQSSVPFLERG